MYENVLSKLKSSSEKQDIVQEKRKDSPIIGEDITTLNKIVDEVKKDKNKKDGNK
jgi:hypothetical protein